MLVLRQNPSRVDSLSRKWLRERAFNLETFQGWWEAWTIGGAQVPGARHQVQAAADAYGNSHSCRPHAKKIDLKKKFKTCVFSPLPKKNHTCHCK